MQEGMPSASPLLIRAARGQGSVLVAHRPTAVAAVVGSFGSRVATAGIYADLGAGAAVVTPMVVLAVDHGLVVTRSLHVVSHLVGEEAPEVVPVTPVAAVASVAAMMSSLVVAVAAMAISLVVVVAPS